MDRLNELYAYKAKYEKEKLFVDAKIAVVEEMITDEEKKAITEENDINDYMPENATI